MFAAIFVKGRYVNRNYRANESCLYRLREILNYVREQKTSAYQYHASIVSLNSRIRGESVARQIVNEYGTSPTLSTNLLVRVIEAKMLGLPYASLTEVGQTIRAFRDELIQLGMNSTNVDQIAEEIRSRSAL